jgi:RNA polymerase sigma-70 factor (ECF subfamily)
MRGYRKLESFESRSNFGTWIYRIAVRCALDKVSRRGNASNRASTGTETESEAVQVPDRAPNPEALLLSG